MTDGELVRQVLTGQTEAYGELARRWYTRLFAFCRSRIVDGHVQDAEDLAQDVLLRAFRSLGSLAEPDHFGPWIRGIAANACSDWGRSCSRHRAALGHQEPDLPLEAAPNRQAGLLADDERTMILRQLETIPDELREVILLRYYSELSYDEMAQWLGVARATVNERLSKARALLRIRLSQLRSDV